MAGSNVRIDQMADEIMKGLTEYADLATDEMKSAVKKAGKTVWDEIKANAPNKTGQYAARWTAKRCGRSSGSEPSCQSANRTERSDPGAHRACTGINLQFSSARMSLRSRRVFVV